MKRIWIAAAFAAATSSALAANVGVSVSVGQPGFYGRVDIGDYPPPVLVYPEPVMIRPMPVGVERQPIYLRVPPGHQRNWRKHCRHYNACGQPAYFVQDNWYNEVYVPRYREEHGRSHEHRDEGHGRRDEGYDRRDGQRGEGHDRGRHHGHRDD